MKRTFCKLVLFLILSIPVFSETIPLTVTELEYGVEISNINAKKQKIAKGKFGFMEFDGLHDIGGDDVVFILKKKNDNISIDLLAEYLSLNKSGLLLSMKNNSYKEEPVNLAMSSNNDYALINVKMSNYDSILVIPLKGSMKNCQAEVKDDNLIITNIDIDYTDDNVLNDKIIEKKCDDLNKEIFKLLETLAKASKKDLKTLESSNGIYIRNNFVTMLNTDGKFNIIGYTGDSKDELIIPSDIEGIPVNLIKSLQSITHAKFKNIVIPNSVVVVADNACVNLGIEALTFEDNSNIQNIGQNAFRYNKLKELNIPRKELTLGLDAFSDNNIKKVSVYKEWNTMYKQYKFLEQEENGIIKSNFLEEVIFEEGCSVITVRAFADCKNLKKVELPSTLTKIGVKAFYNCTSLVDVSIGGIPLMDVNNAEELFENLRNVASGGMRDNIVSDITAAWAVWALNIYDQQTNPFTAQEAFVNCPINLKSKSILLQIGMPSNAF